MGRRKKQPAHVTESGRFWTLSEAQRDADMVRLCLASTKGKKERQRRAEWLRGYLAHRGRDPKTVDDVFYSL